MSDLISLRLAALEARVAALESGGGRVSASSSSDGGIATDAELDGKFDNEPVRKDPSSKYWTGASYIGTRLSDCPPDYLEAFAKHKDACAYMNEKSGDASKAKYIEYDRKDARRARGWRQRIIDGVVTQVPRQEQRSFAAPPRVPVPNFVPPAHRAPPAAAYGAPIDAEYEAAPDDMPF